MPVEIGLLIFLVFIAISLIVAARAAIRSQKKDKVAKKRYRPYQPYGQERTIDTPTPSTTSTAVQTSSSPSESRAAYASADEFFRAGMYDRAKEEYLKTGRVFGAAKSIAAKGREFIPDSLEIISRYAPEREEEMIRNLSRYFFDSGETEISGLILYDSNLIEEADAVLATIGKSIDDISPAGVVEVSEIEPGVVLEEEKSLEELEAIASEVKEEIKEEEIVIKEKEEVPKKITTQPLKVATSDLEDRCSVCLSVIKAGESFVRCPHCDIPSHYAHIVEWIKVKPQCPNCKKKLVSKMFQS
ncbi:MAG: hypothetical protein ACFFDS_07620 [Candidatus Thorarchaeota archaeon]